MIVQDLLWQFANVVNALHAVHVGTQHGRNHKAFLILMYVRVRMDNDTMRDESEMTLLFKTWKFSSKQQSVRSVAHNVPFN